MTPRWQRRWTYIPSCNKDPAVSPERREPMAVDAYAEIKIRATEIDREMVEGINRAALPE